MITKWLYELLLILIQIIMTSMHDVIQTEDFIEYIIEFFDLLTDYMQFAINGMYFVLGPAMYVLIDFAIGYTTARYVVFPVVVIIRRVFIKGGDN